MGSRATRAASAAALAATLLGAAALSAADPASGAASTSRPARISTALLGEEKGATGDWSASFVVRPHQTIKLLAEYGNASVDTQRRVTLRLAFARGFGIVSTRAILVNTLHPTGWPASVRLLAHQGIQLGDYAPGANALVELTVQLPAGRHLPCGMPPARINVITTVPGVGRVSETLTMRIRHLCPTSLVAVAVPD
jgi:hypothetical protein